VTSEGELRWVPPEVPHHDHRARYRFNGMRKRVVATRAALATFSGSEVANVLDRLRREAIKNSGLDYLQVFERLDGERLWVIEDGEPDDEDGVITVLLPGDY
jgi:hypothetical protein